MLALLVAALGATASGFAWPDFRWRVLHDAKYRPERISLSTPETLLTGSAESSSSDAARRNPPVAPKAPPAAPPLPDLRGASTGEWYEVRSTEVRSSSVLPPSRVASYGPGMAVDGRWSTVWVEGSDGDGSGDWIELELEASVTVHRIGVVNGYGKGPRFLENGRVRDATITFTTGSWQTIRLADNNDLQYFDIAPTTTQSVRLTIASVYPGTRWSDTAIGEIRVWGRR
jgi:F5/8 type C domain